MKLSCALFLASTALFLAGCEQSPQAPVTDQSTAPVETRITSENEMLTVDPAIIDLCKKPEGIVESDVSWNASTTGTEGVEIWLQSPEGEKKVWAAGGAVLSGRTGPWMREGSEVILVNGENKQELARVKIKSRPCDK